ncbi:MAG: Ig-like domain-containing protein, partial [Hyphomicrobiaceae bacterium]|nr:Ig-like domain-containing protein [Hyphomicrobiaceae bacterium]
MDRSSGREAREAESFVVSEATVSGQPSSDVRLPARHEVLELSPSAQTLPSLTAYVTQHGAKAMVTEDGRLGLRIPNWGLAVVADSADLVRPFAAAPGRLLEPLNSDPARLLDLLAMLANGGSKEDALGDLMPPTPSTQPADSDTQPDQPDLSGSSSAAGLPDGLNIIGQGLASGADTLSGLNPESRRWGRDDLKRGEAGSHGQNVTTGLGRGLNHLTGLSDEELGHRNGEKLSTFDNAMVQTVAAGVGSSLGHLWLLGDIEYLRASGDVPEDGQVIEARAEARTVYGKLIEGMPTFRAVEDSAFTDWLVQSGASPVPITDARLIMDPAAGTIRMEPTGLISYTPAPGFSGLAAFTYTFTDPRTGEKITGRSQIVVEAVADPASISGAALTDEDTIIPTPVTVTLNDRDGSESIEKVVITGLPVGATLGWDVTLPGRVVQSGRTFTLTGTTDQIQDLLRSLTVDPPHDFHGQIVLGIAVTTIEDKAERGLPGYRDRETVRFDYVVDVVAVADPVTATGDDETTDEDIAVHLDDLAATFGDLVDGSEVHTVEIRGVDPDAKLLQSAGGIEYPFTLAGDGTKTYTLSPGDVPSVWFLPPPDASGTFDGMTIVAIATETSNGDRETASAPIRVVVAPVADPLEIAAPTQATLEDTPVTFGDDIDILVNDPATQTVIEVVVTGFPAGTRIQYTDETGAPQDFVAAVDGTAVTFGGSGSGATEGQIRAALATLTLTPPGNSDRDIALTVSATTEDTGGGGAPAVDTRSVPMVITVAAVADQPDADFSAGPNVATDPMTGTIYVAGTEDQNLAVPVTLDLTDLDGTETMDPVRITGLPAGYGFQGLTRETDGSFIVTGTKAAIQATLAALVIVPPANADDDFTLQVHITARESNPTTAGPDNGDVAVLTSTRVLDIPVVFVAAPDHPVVTGASSVVEDRTVSFGNNIVIARDDNADGSETVTQIVISDVPAAATIGYPGDGTIASIAGVSIVVGTDSSGNPTYTLTRTTGSEADLLDALQAMTLTPPADSDVDISLNVDVTTTDNDGVQGFGTATHVVTVKADAAGDAPILSASGSGNEDQPIHLVVNAALDDTDTSEYLSRVEITGLPTGATLTWTA